jgi:hypothetical protein
VVNGFDEIMSGQTVYVTADGMYLAEVAPPRPASPLARAAPSFYASAQFAGLFVNISIYLRDGKFSTDFPEIHSIAPEVGKNRIDSQ